MVKTPMQDYSFDRATVKKRKRMYVYPIIFILIISSLVCLYSYEPSFRIYIIDFVSSVETQVDDLLSLISEHESTASNEETKGVSEGASESTSTPAETKEKNQDTNSQLIQYALTLINKDRKKHGLRNVTLGTLKCAQKHAEDMLQKGYFSHWDTMGMKPYMRYSLEKGIGIVAENVAWSHAPVFTTIDIMNDIKKLQYLMVYDDAMCNWEHRDTILNPIYNRVNLGIAYDSETLYLVQDFEYVCLEKLVVDQMPETSYGYYVTGDTPWKNITIEGIVIYFDPNPTNKTKDELIQEPYNNGYNQGIFIGMILPKNCKSPEGKTITATTWNMDPPNFYITFSLHEAIELKGEGVYTLNILGEIGEERIFLASRSLWLKNKK